MYDGHPVQQNHSGNKATQPTQPSYTGCNFGVIFTVWDQLFGTANFKDCYPPTGISDQLTGRDYGQGFWAQQWIGLRNMINAIKAKS
jgi:sterol desaturase/sphingolipid hydroxylase (fatty acid hydroxylase superfamily)